MQRITVTAIAFQTHNFPRDDGLIRAVLLDCQENNTFRVLYISEPHPTDKAALESVQKLILQNSTLFLWSYVPTEMVPWVELVLQKETQKIAGTLSGYPFDPNICQTIRELYDVNGVRH